VYACLLNTGSQVCLIPEHIVDPANIRETKRTLKAANGTNIPILGEVTVPVSTGQFVTEVTGLVSKHVTEPMLGIDFLVENGAVWDFSISLIRFGARTFLLHPRQDKHQWCRRVVLTEDAVVPARSQVNVSTKVEVHKLPTLYDGADWGTEPSNVKAGLHVSQTLVPQNAWFDVPLRVMNVKTEPVRLNAGTVIASLQPVEVVEKASSHDKNQTKVKQAEDDPRSVPEYVQKLLDGANGSIPENACLALEAILVKHQDVFSQNNNDLGRTDITMHHIDTGDARPIRQPLRRYPPAHQEEISKHVDNMLKQGTIEQ